MKVTFVASLVPFMLVLCAIVMHSLLYQFYEAYESDGGLNVIQRIPANNLAKVEYSTPLQHIPATSVFSRYYNQENVTEPEQGSNVSFVSFLQSVAVNNTVMTSFTDYGYLQLFYVFYNLSHLERYPNFFLTVIDMKSYIDVKSRGIPVYYYKPIGVDAEMTTRGSIIMTKEFQRKVVNKLDFINSLLSYRYRVLFMDSDLILFRDPWPILSSYFDKGADMVTQQDETINSGFMLLFPTTYTKNLVMAASRHMKMVGELDQESLIFCLRYFPKLQYKLLPLNQFSNGRYFASYHQFFWHPISSEQIMMHNNWIIGTKHKMYRWRELRIYTDDNDDYYSSSTRQYLMIDATDERIARVEFLMQAAVLSRLLQRVFLVPTFPCPDGFYVDRCNLCRNDVLCYEKFQKIIGNDYRSYEFRSNPLTPHDVRQAIENGVTYDVVDSNVEKPNSIKLSSPFSRGAIMRAFSNCTSIRVLKLSNLPAKFPKKMPKCIYLFNKQFTSCRQWPQFQHPHP